MVTPPWGAQAEVAAAGMVGSKHRVVPILGVPPQLLYFRALQMLTGGQSGRKSVFSAQAWESEKPGLPSGATALCLCDLGHVNLCEPRLLRL